MHKRLFLAFALLAAGCAADTLEVHATHGDARLRVTPAVVSDTNTLQLAGVLSATQPVLSAVATMDDMPGKTSAVFVRDGDGYVAKTHFSMAGTWRIHVALDRPADFIVTLK